VQDQFRTYELPHIALLMLIPAIAGGLVWWSGTSALRTRFIRIALGIILLINEVVWYWYYVHQGWFIFPYTLPLQLCDILVWIAVVTALTAHRWPYELLYYWGLAGTSMALLTPDVTSPTFSYLTVRFFVSHGGIIVVILFLTWKRLLIPKPGSWWRAWLYLHLYGAGVGFFNYLFGTNYFYLCEKPAEASLLNYLGPWPWYILAGDAIGFALFWLLWLPFRERGHSIRAQDTKTSRTDQP
jgi:hypothetical integral membrane protein (TIGR02206 family)